MLLALTFGDGRRVSIEYALIKDMNDQEWRAQLLADELNRRGHGWVHVNPIPLIRRRVPFGRRDQACSGCVCSVSARQRDCDLYP